MLSYLENYFLQMETHSFSMPVPFKKQNGLTLWLSAMLASHMDVNLCYGCSASDLDEAPGYWIWLGIEFVLAIVATWEMDQQMEDLSVTTENK